MRMKEKLKGFMVGVIVASLLFSTVFADSVQKMIKVSYSHIKIYVDNELVVPTDGKGKPVEPFTYNGTTYLPAASVAKALGMNVQWDGKTQSVYLDSGYTDSGYDSNYDYSYDDEYSDPSDTQADQISWYFIGNGPQPDVGLIENEANKYLKDKLNARIKLTCFDWGTYEDKMNVKIASGEPFDICFTANWKINYPLFAAKGAFTDLTDMMDKYAPKTKAILGDKVIKGANVNGRLYGIPALKEMAHSWGFLFKKDLINKYNLNTNSVKKFGDVEPLLKVIKAKEPGVYPLEAVVGESPYRVLDFEKIVDDDVPGAVYFDYRDTKVVNDYDTPEAKAFYNTMHKFYQAGYIRRDADSVQDYNADEKAGKIFAHIKSLKPGKNDEFTLSQGVTWTQVELTKPVSTTREMTGSMQAISKTSSNPERALKFLELFNTDPYLNNLINFGIEGRHYVKADSNTIDFAPGTQNGATSGYNPATPWMFGNQFLNYLYKVEDPQKWQKFKAFNDSAVASPLLGFTFDVYPVRNEVAALKNVKKQYFPQLETGKGDPSVVLSKMNAKFKTCGLDKVLAEMQKQVDAYLKTGKVSPFYNGNDTGDSTNVLLSYRR